MILLMHTPVPNVDRDCKMFTPRLRETRHTRGASRYTLQSITSERGANVIYIIHARLEGIAPLEIEALSSAGNIGTLYPALIFVAPSHDLGVGQSGRCIQNGNDSGQMHLNLECQGTRRGRVLLRLQASTYVASLC